MALITGLGNIGSKYKGTRHNIGFEVIDKLADDLSIHLEDGKGPFLIGEGSFKGKKVTLMKPTTFMNLSGKAMSKAVAKTGVSLNRCLVCYDDINLPPGKIRLRPSGSAGGHNGIKDIITSLQTDQFPRMRIGVGNDFGRGRQADYVLSPFDEDQRIIMDQTLETACEAIYTFLRTDIQIAMNEFN